jgi:hypothetical protein
MQRPTTGLAKIFKKEHAYQDLPMCIRDVLIAFVGPDPDVFGNDEWGTMSTCVVVLVKSVMYVQWGFRLEAATIQPMLDGEDRLLSCGVIYVPRPAILPPGCARRAQFRATRAMQHRSNCSSFGAGRSGMC